VLCLLIVAASALSSLQLLLTAWVICRTVSPISAQHSSALATLEASQSAERSLADQLQRCASALQQAIACTNVKLQACEACTCTHWIRRVSACKVTCGLMRGHKLVWVCRQVINLLQDVRKLEVAVAGSNALTVDGPTAPPAWTHHQGLICDSAAIVVQTQPVTPCYGPSVAPWVRQAVQRRSKARQSQIEHAPEQPYRWIHLSSLLTSNTLARVSKVSRLYDSSPWSWVKRALALSGGGPPLRRAAQVRFAAQSAYHSPAVPCCLHKSRSELLMHLLRTPARLWPWHMTSYGGSRLDHCGACRHAAAVVVQVLQPELPAASGLASQCLPLAIPGASINITLSKEYDVLAVCFGHSPDVVPHRFARDPVPSVCQRILQGTALNLSHVALIVGDAVTNFQCQS
jgi:hypothetical protein